MFKKECVTRRSACADRAAPRLTLFFKHARFYQTILSLPAGKQAYPSFLAELAFRFQDRLRLQLSVGETFQPKLYSQGSVW